MGDFRLSIFFLAFFSLLLISCNPAFYQAEPLDRTLTADQGMVVSAHALASRVGVEIMQQGGNAVDAAVASQFALAVVYPRAGNIGGGGFMVIRLPDGQYVSLDYREKAPAKAEKDMFLLADGHVRDSASVYGVLSAGVPGSVDGLITAWEQYGQIRDFSRIITPSVSLARKGFAITQEEADRLNQYQPDFQKFNHFNNPFVKDTPWKAGDLLQQKELASTLDRIRKKGKSGFYQGKTAEKLVKTVQSSGGIITGEDLRMYQSIWREPVRTDYRSHKVVSMPPSSSGGIALIQLLELIEPFDLAGLGFHTKESIHLLVEAEKRVYADRAKFLGDPEFYDVPVDMLLNSSYLAGRMADFDPYRATPANSISPFALPEREHFETTHTSVVDKNRMAVSVTTTLNSNYGSKVLVEGCGFFLNNEMDDFSIKPGYPNQFGLIGSKANAVEPGKRMLSSMTPTIVEKDGQVFLVLGSPGGSTIITTVLQVIINMVDFNMTLDDAVDLPRFHHQFLPDKIFLEKGGLDTQIKSSLQLMGHDFGEYERIGLINAIQVLPDGKLHGVGDRRSETDVEAY